MVFKRKKKKGSISLELEIMNRNTSQVSASYLLFQQNNIQINEVTKEEVKLFFHIKNNKIDILVYYLSY